MIKRQLSKGFYIFKDPKGCHYNAFYSPLLMRCVSEKLMTPYEYPIYNQHAKNDCLISGAFAFLVVFLYSVQRGHYDTS